MTDTLERPRECALCGERFTSNDLERNIAEVVGPLGMHLIVHADPCYLSNREQYPLA